MDKLDNLPANKLAAKEVAERQARVALNSPEQLKAWLQASRPFVVWNSDDLIKAIEAPWPEATQIVQYAINIYRGQRFSTPSGDVKTVKDPVTKSEIQQAIYKDDRLTKTELDRCIRWLTAQVLDIDPDWSLENDPL